MQRCPGRQLCCSRLRNESRFVHWPRTCPPSGLHRPRRSPSANNSSLVAGSVISLIAFGPGRRDAGATGSLLFGFLLYGWLLACSIVSVLIPAPDPARKDIPIWSIVAIVLLPATLIAGCEAGTIVLPT